MHRGDQFLFTTEFNNGYNHGTCTPFAHAWNRRKQAKRWANKLDALGRIKQKKLNRSWKYFGKEGRIGPEGRLTHLEQQIKRIADIIKEETKEAA